MYKLRNADALNNIHRRVHELAAAQQYTESITLIKGSLAYLRLLRREWEKRLISSEKMHDLTTSKKLNNFQTPP